jgi:hypothetical protein
VTSRLDFGPFRAPAAAGLVAAAAALSVCMLAPPASAAAPTGLGGRVQAPSLGERIDIAHDIVLLARAEYDRGVQEVPRGSDYSPDIARYRAALSPRARGGPWCAYFVSWVARAAGVPIGRGGAGIAGTGGIASWAQRTGRWTHLPRPGDVAVFGGHAGIVESVSGSRMTTIDGNWSNRVSEVHRSRGEAIGFARLVPGP